MGRPEERSCPLTSWPCALPSERTLSSFRDVAPLALPTVTSAPPVCPIRRPSLLSGQRDASSSVPVDADHQEDTRNKVHSVILLLLSLSTKKNICYKQKKKKKKKNFQKKKKKKKKKKS